MRIRHSGYIVTFPPSRFPVFLQALDFPNDLCYRLFAKFELTASHFTPVNFNPSQSTTSIERANKTTICLPNLKRVSHRVAFTRSTLRPSAIVMISLPRTCPRSSLTSHMRA
ncbi:hypothetical protein ACN38_g11364 [Penicillium nordicum]|uniref:Uncharacterized protein n=1 Tax=Penicillium nordicum TaxID=229535 RepID=A0A0M9WAT7_9EURO|nr:hypothetical protein ACN38_g11364 [Penicillium nordicum]